MAMKGYTLHSPKLQNWSLTIKLFNFISRIFVGGFLLLFRDAIDVFYSPAKFPGCHPQDYITIQRECLSILSTAKYHSSAVSSTFQVSVIFLIKSITCRKISYILDILLLMVVGSYHKLFHGCGIIS